MTGHRFEATLWRHDGDAPWHFVTVPVGVADEIANTTEPKPFGSLPVRVRIGATSWKTSLFPDNETGSYVLPIKRSVRDSESIEDGDVVSIAIDVGA